MDSLEEIINVLISVTDAGAIARILYCFAKISANPDEEKTYEKRIKHIGAFLILTNCVWIIKAVIESYYK